MPYCVRSSDTRPVAKRIPGGSVFGNRGQKKEALVISKLICLSLLVFFTAVSDLHSQIPLPSTESDDRRRESEGRIQAERELRTQNMRELDATLKAINRPRASVPAGPTMDKETVERIQASRRVNPADVSRYNDLLTSAKSGIFKLLPDDDCVTQNLVRTDGNCKAFVMASSSYSFRTGSYAHPYYHDLGFNHGELFSNAFFSQGILVSLGNSPIEEITLGHDALKLVRDFQPASDFGIAKKSAAQLKAGIEFGSFRYSSTLVPVLNTTYALRSIAYDIANSLPPVPDSTSGNELRFHTLALDKRGDVTVVFRIIRIGEDGSLTIVWKELDRRDAPKIKFAKSEKFIDFKADAKQGP